MYWIGVNGSREVVCRIFSFAKKIEFRDNLSNKYLTEVKIANLGGILYFKLEKYTPPGKPYPLAEIQVKYGPINSNNNRRDLINNRNFS